MDNEFAPTDKLLRNEPGSLIGLALDLKSMTPGNQLRVAAGMLDAVPQLDTTDPVRGKHARRIARNICLMVLGTIEA